MSGATLAAIEGAAHSFAEQIFHEDRWDGSSPGELQDDLHLEMFAIDLEDAEIVATSLVPQAGEEG